MNRPVLPPARDDTVRTLLQAGPVVAVVGLSDKPDRPSFGVAAYLQQQGYRIVPVNPSVGSALGETAFARLEDIPFAVDWVDVFRRTEEVLPIARSALAIGARGFWQQLGVVNAEAQALFNAAGHPAVMDLCSKIEHRRWAHVLRVPGVRPI